MRLEAVRTTPEAGRVDVDAAEAAVADLLAALGRDTRIRT